MMMMVSKEVSKSIDIDFMSPRRTTKGLTKLLKSASRNLVKGMTLRGQQNSLSSSPMSSSSSSSTCTGEESDLKDFLTNSSIVSLDDDSTTSSNCTSSLEISTCALDASRGCLNGFGASHEDEDSALLGKMSRGKHVHFSASEDSEHVCTTTHTIEPLFQYSDDLWWTKNELKELRSVQPGFRPITKSDRKRLRPFIVAYETAREEVNALLSMTYSSSSSSSSSSSCVPSCELSGDIMYELSLGYARGYNGLEKYIAGDVTHRRQFIQNHTMELINYHVELAGSYEKQELLASFSRGLTASDRYWALVSGKASEVAVLSE